MRRLLACYHLGVLEEAAFEYTLLEHGGAFSRTPETPSLKVDTEGVISSNGPCIVPHFFHAAVSAQVGDEKIAGQERYKWSLIFRLPID